MKDEAREEGKQNEKGENN